MNIFLPVHFVHSVKKLSNTKWRGLNESVSQSVGHHFRILHDFLDSFLEVSELKICMKSKSEKWNARGLVSEIRVERMLHCIL